MITLAWKVNTEWTYKAKRGFPEIPKPKNYSITQSGISLGKQLFYDKMLSIDNDISCGTCHRQENAFAQNVTFSVGRNNSPQQKNTLPLFNIVWNKTFFWDGRVKSLEEQIPHPLLNANEMGSNFDTIISRLNGSSNYRKMFKEVYSSSTIDSALIVNSIAQFLRTLISDNAKFDSIVANKAKFTAEEYEGFEIVSDQSKHNACINCHSFEGQSLGTNLGLVNNGIAAPNEKMKVPSLRNLKFTGPYMHDGRFKTLEEVIDYYSSAVPNRTDLDFRMKPNRGKEIFTTTEKRKILAFLNTLNDFEFIRNPNFAEL